MHITHRVRLCGHRMHAWWGMNTALHARVVGYEHGSAYADADVYTRTLLHLDKCLYICAHTGPFGVHALSETYICV